MNQNYFEPNHGYDSNYSGFDQPPQYTIDHQPDEGMSKSDIVFEEIKMMFQQLMKRLNEENKGKIKEINQERTISLRDIISQLPSSIVITTSPPVLPIEDPEVSLIMANEELSTIPEKESDEFIKSSVEDLVPILRESEDTSESDSECILPSDDESLSDKDVLEDNLKIYSNPLFEFDDEYISSDVNPLFDEVLKNIEGKDSYESNLDEPDLLVTSLFDANKDECFDSGGDDDEINVLDYEDSYHDLEGDIFYLESLLNDDLVHYDPSIPAMSVASILEEFIDELSLEENDGLFDLEPKNDDWKKILYDAPINNLMIEDKILDLGIHEKSFLRHM
uniref:Reverse transcriptase domain-containing protein n=1 Tax=Tanacetum cinerariifolium TaxID=118510 RepID=A0A699I6L4_TANCI|nr:hypothetical protein [Tanacetum cinerariifolium]